MLINKKEVMKKDDLHAVINFHGQEVEIGASKIIMGDTNPKFLTQGDYEVMFRISMRYPDGEYEYTNETVSTSMSVIGDFIGDTELLVKWFVNEICGLNVEEVID